MLLNRQSQVCIVLMLHGEIVLSSLVYMVRDEQKTDRKDSNF